MEQVLIAILLGIVEGVTEFLPISSTGHLILLIDILGFDAPKGKVFEIVVQLGAILAICVLFKQKILEVLLHLHNRKASRLLALKIIIAFLPAAIGGALLHSFIKHHLFSPIIVSTMLVVGGLIILIVERIKPLERISQIEEITLKQAGIIGICQAIAMIPGTSRSGATMMGSLMLGINRKTAAEFSFLLAIPTMLAATLYDIYKNYHHLNFDDAQIIGIGFISAFISALLAVRFLLNFLSNHGFAPFAYYRIALGAIMLAILGNYILN
jgi:undecaprenyl-diphosphatase